MLALLQGSAGGLPAPAGCLLQLVQARRRVTPWQPALMPVPAAPLRVMTGPARLPEPAPAVVSRGTGLQPAPPGQTGPAGVAPAGS